jgi:hypothetical protein
MQPTREGNGADAERKPRSRRFRNTLILGFLGIIILAACIFSINWLSASQQDEDANGNGSRAAILDGLYDKSPNATLTETMKQYLSNSGYTVDNYRGTNVTIDLLKNIGGYKVLILRLHSGVTKDGWLYIYSGEKYTQDKYVFEQLAGDVKRGNTFDESEAPYFALNSKFLGELASDDLDGTTLILMGCNGSANEFVVQDFFQKGIKAYVSWDGYVDLPHSDKATLRLVEAIYSEGLSPQAAVEKVNNEVGSDPFFKSKLVCLLP